MLLALEINNFALIHKLYIEFGNGLNIITGETGAGKSIVVDSINFVLGSKFTKDIIKKGFDKAEVNAVFDLSDLQVEALYEMGFDCDDNQISLMRTINSMGKTVCRVNSKITTLAMLKQISAVVMEVHGQHENQILFNSVNHIDFLDSYTFKDDDSDKIKFAKSFSDFKNFRNKILNEKMDSKSINLRLSILNEQLKEFEVLKWKPGEEERLSLKVTAMENAEAISTAINTSYDVLYSEEGCALERIGVAKDFIGKISDLDNRYSKIFSSLESIYYDMEEAVSEIRAEKKDEGYNPELLEQLQKRLFEFGKLKKKYNTDEGGIISYFEKLKAEKDDLEYNLGHASELKEELKKLYKLALADAKALSEKRINEAKILEQEVLSHLGDLGMPNARFSVDFENKDLGSKGIDNVEFLFCANKGQDLKPLTKVASGGEISRLMLAFKNVNLDSSLVDAMVFDEIDTGISGKMAQAVAEKLNNIAKNNQVICVTHLPQVAAMGDVNIFVSKQDEENETIVSAQSLDFDGKVNEVARLISGSDITESGLQHAKQLIEESKR